MLACVMLGQERVSAEPPAGLLNPDFEAPDGPHGPAGWTKTGNAFDFQPIHGESIQAQRVGPVSVGGDYWKDVSFPIGIHNNAWIGTGERGRIAPRVAGPAAAATGTLTSTNFKIAADTNFITFLIGGGENIQTLKIELLEARGGTPIAVTGVPPKTGLNSEILRRDWWNVGALDKSKEYVIRITDNETNGVWAHINIDHMSEKAANATLEIAKQFKYPVNSGHTGFRRDDVPVPPTGPDSRIHENSRTIAQLKTLGELGGMMGVGWAQGDAYDFLLSYRYGVERKSRTGEGPAFTLGSDINGFVRMPKPRSKRTDPVPSDLAPFARTQVMYGGPNALTKYSFGGQSWNYNEVGVAHIGLYPDIYQDLKNIGMSLPERSEFFSAANAFALMWDMIEEQKGNVPQ